MDFAEYALTYLKHKDLIKRQIVKIHPKVNDSITVEYKTKTENLSIQPKFHEIKGTIIATQNEEHNVKALLKMWNEAVAKDVAIIFLDEKNHTKWMIRPSHHEKISEKKDIERGVLSIYQSSFER
jgi:hypothetical protein